MPDQFGLVPASVVPMYTDYFDLRDLPFQNTLDPRFVFLSERHKEMLDALSFFVRDRRGFALICGDVGSGKTMLINTFLASLPDSVQAILISNPGVDYEEILLHLAADLGIPNRPNGLLGLINEVETVLEEYDRQGNRHLLVIDEAHLLSAQSLEHIRLLSNIETTKYKLLPILLVGQNELSAKLNRPELRQLKQRIDVKRFLAPMDSTETERYVDHRLRVAGGTYQSCLESSCKRLIHRLTGGLPRCINQLCDSAFSICEAANQPKVNRRILRKAQEALHNDVLFTGRAGRKTIFPITWKTAVLAGPYLGLLVVMGILGQAGLLGQSVQRAMDRTLSAVLRAPTVERDQVKADMVRIVAGKEVDASVKPPSSEPGSEKEPAEELLLKARGIYATTSESRQIEPSQRSVLKKAIPKETAPEPEVQPTASDSSEAGAACPQEGLSNDATIDLSLVSVRNNQRGETPQKVDSDSTQPSTATETVEPTTATLLHEAEKMAERRPSRVRVKQGESITSIARRWYPENPQAGVRTILQANPGIADSNLVYPGQILKLMESTP